LRSVTTSRPEPPPAWLQALRTSNQLRQ
jgi:hypothetical protein